MSPGSESHTVSPESPAWEPTARILCECNCGIQVQLGGDDGRQFASALKAAIRNDPRLAGVAPALLYRTLGETLPPGAESAAALWSAAQVCAARFADSIRRAGIEGDDSELGDSLFDAIVGSPTGVVFSIDPPDISWKRVQAATGRLQLAIPPLFEAIEALGRSRGPAITSEAFPLVWSG